MPCQVPPAEDEEEYAMITIKQELELLAMLLYYKDNLVEVRRSHSHGHITNQRVSRFSVTSSNELDNCFLSRNNAQSWSV